MVLAIKEKVMFISVADLVKWSSDGTKYIISTNYTADIYSTEVKQLEIYSCLPLLSIHPITDKLLHTNLTF